MAPALALIALLSACAPGMRLSGDGEPGRDRAAPAIRRIDEQLLQSERRQRERQDGQALDHLMVREPPPYAIGRGDILSIVVWDHPELAGAMIPGLAAAGGEAAGFVVDGDGQVQFPYAGVLRLAGLTQEQARGLLAARLARYIRTPAVALRVRAHRSQRVYIDGEVKTPGPQAIDDIPMTLLEALNRAGGLLATADQSRIMLDRDGASYRIDLPQLVRGAINPAALLLAHGDVLRVPSRDDSKVFVSGEVVAPRALTMRNGRLTLNEALGEAGGVSPLTGDGRQVYVVRRAGGEPVVYQLDARSPGALAMAEQFELHPRDVVYVAASPLVNWHRSISLLFPGTLTSVVGSVKP